MGKRLAEHSIEIKAWWHCQVMLYRHC